MQSIEVSLIEKYGPLMTLKDLAHLLRRSPNGIRMSLHYDNDISNGIKRARKKLGRRVYYRTSYIAQLIEDDSDGK